MSITTQTQNSESQTSYKETPYEDSSWEVVGEGVKNLEFTPMAVEVVAQTGTITDKMFADFGGYSTQTSEERWHLPEKLAHSYGAKQQIEEEEVEDTLRIKEEELEAVKNKAFEEGKLIGLQEAIESQTNRLAASEKHFTQTIQDLNTQIVEIINSVSRQAVELAVEIAHKIIEQAVEINPEYLLTVIEEALKHSGGAVIRKVRVSPQDMEFIRVVGVAKQIKGFDGSWQFEADETVKAGCIVETSAGEIDFDIEKAWERVRDSVVKVVRS